jgi:RimJ/RimL family protein N-acetyltransferase
MERSSDDFQIRLWQSGDEEALTRIANNRQIWRNLSDRFPHPYELAHADYWIANANLESDRARHFAIILDGDIVGGVGFERLRDLHTRTAEIGYWVGEPFWGAGIATRALRAAIRINFRDYDFVRLQAGVLEWNPASCRVLEKAGYSLEGRHRKQAYQDGEICDQFLYALLRESPSSR